MINTISNIYIIYFRECTLYILEIINFANTPFKICKYLFIISTKSITYICIYPIFTNKPFKICNYVSMNSSLSIEIYILNFANMTSKICKYAVCNKHSIQEFYNLYILYFSKHTL